MANVLIIEDDRDIAEVFQAAFAMENITSYWAPDGREGLRIAEATRPDVIVTDLMMPVLDGFGFLKEYLAKPGKHAPVIAVSAMGQYASMATQCGAVQVLMKPVELEVLLRSVQRLIHEKNPELTSATPPAMKLSQERERLRSIVELQLDHPAPENTLDEFVQYVARLFDVPICLISIITEDRQFWTAMCGISGDLEHQRGSARNHSFCTHAVAARAALVVQDAVENPYFQNNLFVQKHKLRFYAGVPLITRLGHAVGTLCLLDFKSREFTHLDLELLGVLAKRVQAELEWRERHIRPEAPDSAFRFLNYIDLETGLVGREGFRDVLNVQISRHAEMRSPLGLYAIALRDNHVREVKEALSSEMPNTWIGRIGARRLGVISPGEFSRELIEEIERIVNRFSKGGRVVGIDAKQYLGASELALYDIESALGEEGLSKGKSLSETG